MTISEQYELISNEGKYIGVRQYYNYFINLYLLDDSFYELWYFRPTNEIEKIEKMDDEKKLDLYIQPQYEIKPLIMKKSILLLILILTTYILYAQDYLISFSGSGESSVVESVTIENLTQAKSITISGSDTLHLLESVTGINSFQRSSDSPLNIYPNPSTNYCTVKFGVNKRGTAMISIFDLLGREMIRSIQPLTMGIHSFSLSGLNRLTDF